MRICMTALTVVPLKSGDVRGGASNGIVCDIGSIIVRFYPYCQAYILWSDLLDLGFCLVSWTSGGIMASAVCAQRISMHCC